MINIDTEVRGRCKIILEDILNNNFKNKADIFVFMLQLRVLTEKEKYDFVYLYSCMLVHEKLNSEMSLKGVVEFIDEQISKTKKNRRRFK